ncbi:MAG: sulfatase-like hydrolase/transferase [Armatimonadia bacterium]|nr:sulfatase-like hydrolase/transferase [Armatimonadia bacterium]
MAQLDRPNILIFVPHDLGQHVGCYGVETVHTPNIDGLARDGVRFERSFCTAPQCSPSRASLFTSRYPHSNGVMGLTHADFAWDLHDDERHLGAILRDAGYHTACTGHPHEARTRELLGMTQMLPGGRAWNVSATVTEFLEDRRGQDQPFFLEVCTIEPHRLRHGFGAEPDNTKGVTIPPFIYPELSSEEDFADFQGAIRLLDEHIGIILSALERTGQAGNTLVIMTADHGMPFPRAKCSLYDPGLEVPLIMRHPGGGWEPGTVHSEMISNIDVMPTILDLLGMDTPPNAQGLSFAPLLAGGQYEARERLFGEMTYHDYCDPRRCVRTETHKLIVNFTTAPFFMNPSQTYRPKSVTRTPEEPAYAYHPPVELYDLVSDPWEETNLAEDDEHAPVRDQLLAALHDWMVETEDPLLNGIPDSPMHHMAMTALRGG